MKTDNFEDRKLTTVTKNRLLHLQSAFDAEMYQVYGKILLVWLSIANLAEQRTKIIKIEEKPGFFEIIGQKTQEGSILDPNVRK